MKKFQIELNYPNISFELEEKEKSLEEDLMEKNFAVNNYLNELVTVKY